MKLYTKEQLTKKYANKFINVYPHHHEVWDDKEHRYKTVYEVISVKSKIWENHNLPELIN